MNAIRKALDDIKRRIPISILEKTFLNSNRRYGSINTASLDDLITRNVIKSRVLVDCNLIGGVEELIPLAGLPFEVVDNNSVVVRIPKSRTQGKSINSVLNVNYFTNRYTGTYNEATGLANSKCPPNQILNAANALMSSQLAIPQVSTARLQLVGENVLLIKDVTNLPPNSQLRCILANDDEMSTLPLRSYRYFTNLCEYAVKSHIYNELIVDIDQDQLQGGAQLGIFKEIVQGYSEAEQNYSDYLNDVMEVVLFQSDDSQYNRLIKLAVGGCK